MSLTLLYRFSYISIGLVNYILRKTKTKAIKKKTYQTHSPPFSGLNIEIQTSTQPFLCYFTGTASLCENLLQTRSLADVSQCVTHQSCIEFWWQWTFSSTSLCDQNSLQGTECVMSLPTHIVPCLELVKNKTPAYVYPSCQYYDRAHVTFQIEQQKQKRLSPKLTTDSQADNLSKKPNGLKKRTWRSRVLYLDLGFRLGLA